MKTFDYVMYENKICVLTEIRENQSSVAGVMMPETGDSYFVFECDVSNDKIETYNATVSEKSIVHRLREWRKSHPDIFNFLEQELSLIHPFIKK